MTGPRLVPAEQSVACAINRAAGGRPVPGNQVDLLIDGPDTYHAMLEVIAQAGLPVHLRPAPVVHPGVRFVRPIHANARPSSRSRERGGSDTTK